MKIAIVNLPFPPIGNDPVQDDMIRRAALNALGSPTDGAEKDVVVAMFPDGQHRVAKNRDNHEITVVNR